MENANRPVWTASQIAEQGGVTRATAHKRLKKLAESEDVETVQVGNATAYYRVGITTKPVGEGGEPVKRDLRRSFTDRFVGLMSDPSTAIHPNDGRAEAGDRVQLQVEGEPGKWRVLHKRHPANRRSSLEPGETHEDGVQALVSGDLYGKTTTPIEHSDYPDEYDLEAKTGAVFREIGDGPWPVLVVPGPKSYLLNPCNNAVFLQNVEVDWVSLHGEGPKAVDGGMMGNLPSEPELHEILEEQPPESFGG